MSKRAEPQNRRRLGPKAVDSAGVPAPSPLPFWRSDGFAGLVLVAAALLAYLRVWHAGFIWDDEMHLTANPVIVGPLGLKEIWTTRAARICPLVLTTFWFEHALWGLRPLPYHVVNVLMHGAGAVALWRVLRSLRVPGAWLGAALWALHPVQVETVAWVTELKNTQSGLFYLLAILFFVRWLQTPEAAPGRSRSYALALFLAALAMASKSSTVVLPLVLGLCAWWTGTRGNARLGARLAPFLLLSAAASALALWTQHLEGANEMEWMRGWPERIAVAGRIFWFYAGKLAWPHPLVFIYPRWRIEWTEAASYLPSAALAGFLAVLWWGRRGALRGATFAFAYFLVALLPVLGVADQFFWRYSFVGDHFQYLASMGPLALLAAGITRAFERFGIGTWSRRIVGTGLLGLLAILTWRQSGFYRDSETLWRATLAGNPKCWIADNNLGVICLDSGRRDEAIRLFQQALVVRPTHVEAHYNLGNALLAEGRTDEAMAHFQKALELDPGFDKAHNNLGNALLREGRVGEAVAEFNRALEANPGSAEAQTSLGNAFLQAGRLDEADAHYRAALQIAPGSVDALSNLGAVALKRGNAREAAGLLQRALAAQPDLVRAEVNLGNAYLQMDNLDGAASHYRRATEIEPGFAEAHNNLGFVLLHQGRLDEAVAECRKALAINPSYAEAHRNLGTALFKQGKVDEADAQFQLGVQPR
jgi:tetratricopeptide (TPR) repeat protein